MPFSALYGILHQNFKELQTMIEKFIPPMMAARAFRDVDGTTMVSGSHLFKVIFVTFFGYTCRYKDALEVNLGMRALIKQLAEWFYEWEASFESATPFDDPDREMEPSVRRFTHSELRKKVESLLNVVDRARTVVVHQSNMQAKRVQDIANYRHEATLARLQREYQGPGEQRRAGPRHDNDKVNIQEIRISPTQDELLCTIPPYLPANIPNAPHQHPADGVQRLLDVQFRLLREELVAPIRTAVQLLANDLAQPEHAKTQLSDILKSKGGRYHGQPVTSAQDSVIFSIFTNVAFGPFMVDKRGCSIGVLMDTPPGDARLGSSKQRAAYWEAASKKRLMRGGLVALLLKDGANPLGIFTGLISSNTTELGESALANARRIGVRVSFFDAAIELRIARELQESQKPRKDQMHLLIEAPVLYEGIRPFLLALQGEPETLPLADYLRHHADPEHLSLLPATPPRYAQQPGFTFELESLLRGTPNSNSLRLDANDPCSIAQARQELAKSSSLDESQAGAVVDALTREISLIQGPPGTGKSYTGVEIIKLLVRNAVTPIVLMAFTNHALDHMLLSVLDKVTTSIARLGSRSSDERLSQFSLHNMTRESTEHKVAIGRKWKAMKEAEDEMKVLMNSMIKKHVPRQDLNTTVLLDCPEHYDNIFTPPRWIGALYIVYTDVDDGWDVSGNKKRGKPSKLEFWRDGQDLSWLSPPDPKHESADLGGTNRYAAIGGKSGGNQEANYQRQVRKHQAQRLAFLQKYGQLSIPPVPSTNRPLEVLEKDACVWSMSVPERQRLFQRWKAATLERMGDSRLNDFLRLRDSHAEARQEYQNIQDQVQVNLLKGIHVIGCTTTGAAKLVSLFASIEPRVMIVEEAGQVLEAHVLAALVPSISQVIMIGDPLQLRPNLVNYSKIYQFDRSLMERLADSGLHMSRLDVQRRMRPDISSLIRNTLYPGLIDYPDVKNYPDVDMIYAFVKHLLRQGCYGTSAPGSGTIVVLSAYLGQIPKLHAKFKGEITTVVDERDVDQLAERGLETDIATVEQVELSKRVLIRTLDNFQGEEGDIIILSLARNAGTAFLKDVTSLEYDERAKSSVGFLKSINRTNVGLSRAKQGLYILGNAPELATASKMWATVLQELDSKGLVGSGFPIACSRHPDYVRSVQNPEMFAIHAPDGLTLKELGVGDSLDERTITLACQHTFTVETLDGVAELNKFYAQDANSKWVSTTLPDLTGEVRPRPVCPTCRGPLTSRRYGRVFKRADLDVLEHNVASIMSSELFAAQTTLQKVRGGIEARVISGINTAKAMNPGQSPVASKILQEKASEECAVLLNRGGAGPTPPELLSQSLSEAHLIDVQQQDAWTEAIEPVLGAYIRACELFNKRSSYSVAYEGSFAALYRDEIAKSLASPSTMSREPEQLAMRLARMRIGDAPPPRTDKRFLLEAFCMTVEILLLLGRMAQRCSELLSDRANDTRLWHDFAYFIFKQAQADAEKALTMARDSESHRKVVSCSLLLLRAEMAIARFRLKDKIGAQGMTASLRAELQSEHARTGELFKSRIGEIERDYKGHFGTASRSGVGEWFRENFGTHADALLKSWEEVKDSIRLGTWYATVTNEERLSIVKAFNFGHSGHFYRCPNGHPYVITECGGAMQESRCPECHAPIGGGSHRLRSDNTRDTELVSLARGQGSAVNPWM
ncbi:hypothetical protein FRC06_001443 [Ceratobasidium sp. 370]|nr:hypothetical protein FRC06_001443 [Ceratobasidium sp. 370]